MIIEIERPDWCQIGNTFNWEAPHITGAEVVREKIIGYTDTGFLHTSHNCPVYETPFYDLHYGKLIKEV